MSKTGVVTSGDVNVRVASHLSKVPPIATDAFTKNLIELSSGVTTNTGTCALPRDGREIDAARQRILNPSITPLNPIVDTRHPVSKILQSLNFHLNRNRLQSPCYFDQFWLLDWYPNQADLNFSSDTVGIFTARLLRQ